MNATDSTAQRILVVEPDGVSRRLLRLLLEPEGFLLEEWSALPASAEAVHGGLAAGKGRVMAVLVNGNLLARAHVPDLEDLIRRLGGPAVIALQEPPGEALPLPQAIALSGRVEKPIAPQAILPLLTGGNGGVPNPAPSAARTGPAHPGAVPAGSPPVLDGFHGLIAEMEMDRPMIDELTQSYLSRSSEYLQKLETALADQDLKTIEVTSHTMKGMSANLRFGTVTGLCERITLSGRNGDLETCALLLRELREANQAVSEAIGNRWPPAP